MKISVSSYSFAQYMKNGKMTQLDVPSKAKEIGLGAVEFTDLEPCENPTLEQQKQYASEIRAEADKLGMDINAYTIRGNLYHDNAEDNARSADSSTLQRYWAFRLCAMTCAIRWERREIHAALILCCRLSPITRAR